MDCRRVKELAAQYGSGRLAHGAMSAIEDHAAGCSACEDLLLEACGLGDELEAHLQERAQAPDHLLDSIHAALPHQDVAESDTCYAMGSQVSAYADGELRGEEALRASEHLDDCEACSRKLAFLGALTAELRGLRVEPSERLWSRLLRAVDGAVRSAYPSTPWWHRLVARPAIGLVASTAAVLAVFAVGLGAGQFVWDGSDAPSVSVPVTETPTAHAYPLVRSLPKVGLAEARRKQIVASNSGMGTGAINSASNPVLVRKPSTGRVVYRSPRAPVARVTLAASPGSESRNVDTIPAITVPDALEPDGVSDGTNRKGGSSDLIGRAWDELVRAPVAGEAEIDTEPRKDAEAREAEALIVEAVSFEKDGGPVDGMLLEPSASAVLY